MDFLKFLERGGLPEDSGLSEAECRLGATVLQSADSLAQAAEGGIPETFSSFDGEALRALGEAHRAWRRWSEALDEIDEEPLQEWAGEHTFRPEHARFLAEVDPAVDDAQALLALFIEALESSRTQASIKVSAAGSPSPNDGRADDPYLEIRGRRLSLSEVGPSRWLAIRQGVSDKKLAVEFSPNVTALREQCADRGDDVIEQLQSLVVPTLAEGLQGRLDEEADLAVVRAAINQYSSLLRSRAVRAESLVAIYVGRARDPLGLALLDREGRLTEHTVLHAGPDWGQRLERFVRDHRPEHAVLPSDGPAPRLLQEVGRRLPPRMPTARVRRAALDLARRTLKAVPDDLPPVVQAAVALGRRALDPAGEWGRLDPAQVQLVDHQGLVDPAWLTEALVEARLTKSAGGPSRAPRPPGAAAPPAVAAAPVNPLSAALAGSPLAAPSPAPGGISSSSSAAGRRRVVVEAPRARSGRGRASLTRREVEVIGDNVEVRSLDDLRPGLHVRGTVTNTSRFGAFVAMGLPEEGLIHVSELADQYVADPGEVVTIGQELIARVIQVDSDRKRVSLSLKDVDPSIVAMAPPSKSAAAATPSGEPAHRDRPEHPDDLHDPTDLSTYPGDPSSLEPSAEGAAADTPAPPTGATPATGATPGPMRSGVPQSRSAALAELNRLFKGK